MSLTDKDIRHVARLARLSIQQEDLETVRRDLNSVLDYVGQLAQLDTDEIPPTMHVVPVQAPLRQDTVGFSLSSDEALRNGPQVVDQMFVVPRIMDGGEG